MGVVLKCVAIDDEPPALSLLERYISGTEELELCGSFLDGVKGLQFITQHTIDVLFIDIRMPDLNGIEIVRTLTSALGDKRPMIIFITAFVDFAIEGFNVEAIDFILKPYSYQTFLKAVHKASRWKELKITAGKNADANYIFLRADHKTVKIDCEEILYIEGLKDYARINLAADRKSILTIVTLKTLEKKLPSTRFMRIHKSYIVALNKISAISRNAVLIGSKNIPVSAPYKAKFEKFSSGWSE